MSSRSDLDALVDRARAFERQCSSCDDGFGICTCPAGDPRAVISDLIEGIYLLRVGGRSLAANAEHQAARLAEAEAERDRRGDELRRAQGVIEAAKVWAAAVCTLHQPQQLQAAVDRLAAAIDALDHGKAGRDG